MKRKIIKLAKKALSLFNGLIPKHKKRIIFKSVPDYAGNAKALSDYVKRNYTNYELIWLYSKYKKNDELGVRWIKTKTILSYYYILTSKYIVTTHNELVSIKGSNQLYISLWHGMPLKKIGYLANKEVETMEAYSAKRIATSEIMRSIIASAFHERVDNVVITGQPRNDFLFEKIEFDFFKKNNYKKIILYAPTYRQNSYGLSNSDGAAIQNDNFLRVDDFDIDKLSTFLDGKGILLLVKLHPFEERALDGIDFPSSIKIIKSDQFNSSGNDINHLLAISDCLLTDYSSVYFDYLILNKPIGFVVPDYEMYKNNRSGFTLEPADYWMPGEKINSQSQLLDYLDAILEHRLDKYEVVRAQVNDALNVYKDNFNSKRVFDMFIREEMI